MTPRTQQGIFALAALALVASCKPSFGQPPYLITETTLLAVRGEPPEVNPGASVTYSFLLASPDATVTGADAEWDICLTPKPPSESNAVASACTGAPDAGAAFVGLTFKEPVPTKACQLFGPIAPPPAAGQPAVRPRDPDSTGGFYLPVQVWLPSASTAAVSGFALERIKCNLANASSDIVQTYNSTYQVNNDPGIDHTDLLDAAGTTVLSSFDPATPTPVHVGDSVTIRVTFAAGSAEVFPVYDPEEEKLVPQTESLHVSWFVTGGTFEHDRTGVAAVDAGDIAASTSNQWTAPAQPGNHSLWVVLRDSRGGTDYKSYPIAVTP